MATESPPRLPHSLIAKIVSFNVGSVVDLAKLRRVVLDVIKLFPAFASSGSSPHFVHCPPKNDTFLEKLLLVHRRDPYENTYTAPGDEWTFLENAMTYLFEGTTKLEKMFFLACREDILSELSVKDEVDESFVALFDKINGIKTMEKLAEVVNEIKEVGLPIFVPTEATDGQGGGDDGQPQKKKQKQELYLVKLNLSFGKEDECIDSRLADNILLLKSTPSLPQDSEKLYFHPTALQGAKYPAIITGETDTGYSVQLLLVLAGDSYCGEIADFIYEDNVSLTSTQYDEAFREFQEKETVLEGVAIVDGFIGKDFRDILNAQINTLAEKQESQGLLDYHPHSNNIVRDIVHPALYSYIKGVSPLSQKTDDVRPCSFPSSSEKANDDSETDGKTDPVKDFWGRQYEESKYQWLPTYFSVDKNGKVVIEDYINNLVPRDQHGELYGSLAKMFQQALPYMESVYSYIRAVRPQIRDEDWEPEGDEELRPLEMDSVSFRGQQLQVICKIVDYELDPGQKYEGVWHVEGMSHEEIVLTCLYIMDRDQSVKGGEILFKRTFLDDEADYVRMSVDQIRHPVLNSHLEEGLLPLGKVQTSAGRLIVFPNSHVHKVSEMMCEGTATAGGKRRIVVFFLVNPLRRIVSTREVPCQQEHAGGSMSLEEAKKHRLELMKERKFTKQDWNVRDIELCEH